MNKRPWKEYTLPIDRKKMSHDARLAYESYCGQVRKCKNPKNRWYKYYGGKGIEVEYTAKEFIGWWLYHRPNFTGKIATTGRIDHNKNYCFENIIMQCSSDNSREAITRNFIPYRSKIDRGKRVLALNKNTNEEIITFLSIRAASQFFSCNQRLIHFLISGKYKNSKKIPYNLKLKGKH